MRFKKPGFLSSMRRSDKIILGVIAVLVFVTVVLNILQRCGLSLINAAVTIYLPVLSLVALVGWIAYALIRRIRSRGIRLAVGALVGLAVTFVMMIGVTYLNLLTYTVLPHAYKTVSDPSGRHQLVVLWQLDNDAERYDATIEARKAARLEQYPDSGQETTLEDMYVAFSAYPKVMGLFYRNNADVEGKVLLAYTGNIAPMTTMTVEAEDGASVGAADDTDAAESTDAAETTDAAEATPEVKVIDMPHGTMMLEWLDDGDTAHFYVDNPGTGEGGECTVRLGK